MTLEQRKRAEAISRLIRLGWNPPTPTEAIAQRILDDIATVDQWGATIDLTDRELVTLRLLADGHTAVEIAQELELSPETVRDRTKSINLKLGARNTANAVHIADQQGLLEAA